MGIAFSGIREDYLDELASGDSEDREYALRIRLADAREDAAYSGGTPSISGVSDSSDVPTVIAWLEARGYKVTKA